MDNSSFESSNIESFLNVSQWVDCKNLSCQECSAKECIKNENVIWSTDVIQRVVSIVIIMFFTFVGNIFIIVILSFSRYRKRNRVNTFIINLAVGDLAVCFVTMTTEILFVAFGEWVLGPVMCKLLTYLEIVTLASTTFILTAMSLDRYIAICKPLRFQSSVHRPRKMIFISWMLSFIFAIPQTLIFVQTVDDVTDNGREVYGCRSKGYTAEWQRKLYFTSLTTYILIIPIFIISFCYINVAMAVWRQGRQRLQNQEELVNLRSNTISRAKLKTIKMTLAIIILFLACWSPYFITTIIRIYSNYTIIIPKHVMVFAETAALCQSALNPILYAVFNIQLKRDLKDVFCRKRAIKSESQGQDKLPEPTQNLMHGHINEQQGSNTTSSSYSSNYGTKYQGYLIAEKNTGGIKLRVKFIKKHTPSIIRETGQKAYTEAFCMQ